MKKNKNLFWESFLIIILIAIISLIPILILIRIPSLPITLSIYLLLLNEYIHNPGPGDPSVTWLAVRMVGDFLALIQERIELFVCKSANPCACNGTINPKTKRGSLRDHRDRD